MWLVRQQYERGSTARDSTAELWRRSHDRSRHCHQTALQMAGLLDGGHHWNFKGGVVAGTGIDGDRGGLVVGGPGIHDVGHESLGVAVVEREPGALNFDHDCVAGLENVIDVVQREFKFVD